MCPAHLALEHIGLLKQKFVGRTQGLPLFPTEKGEFVAKEAAVKSYEQIAVHCGEPLRDDMERRRFTGHSTRVSGAKYLAGIGLELYKLAVLARWASPVIIRYVGEAPMKSITADCRRLLAGEDLHQVLASLAAARSPGPTTMMPQFEAELKDYLLKAVDNHPAVQNLTEATRPFEYILNEATCVVHRCRIEPLSISDIVVTQCGWHCNRLRIRLYRDFPKDEHFSRLCEKAACFGSFTPSGTAST
jgi:hypothetical protein